MLTDGFCAASTRVVLLLNLLVEGSSTRGRQQCASHHVNKVCPQSRPPLSSYGALDTPSGAELLVSAAISSHATSHTRKRNRLGSRVNSGSDKKKARGSPGELAPATASSTALRLCIV